MILVLDFGSQYTQLIARRVREARVYCEILPCTVDVEQVVKRKPQGIILSGGPASVYEPDGPQVDPGLFDLGVTTFQNFDTGGWDSDLTGTIPGNAQLAFPFSSLQGAEYIPSKFVYLSPKIAGFDSENVKRRNHSRPPPYLGHVFLPSKRSRFCPV